MGPRLPHHRAYRHLPDHRIFLEENYGYWSSPAIALVESADSVFIDLPSDAEELDRHGCAAVPDVDLFSEQEFGSDILSEAFMLDPEDLLKGVGHEPQNFEQSLIGLMEPMLVELPPAPVAVPAVIPADISSELAVVEVPVGKKRRAKVPTPQSKPTPAWVAKRKRINERAKKNRDREKAAIEVPVGKKRRAKVPTPQSERTPAWVAKRKRNNECAKENRDREKAAKLAAKTRHQDLLRRNADLRAEVQQLESQLAGLKQQAGRPIPGIFAGLSPSEFSVLPPSASSGQHMLDL